MTNEKEEKILKLLKRVLDLTKAGKLEWSVRSTAIPWGEAGGYGADYNTNIDSIQIEIGFVDNIRSVTIGNGDIEWMGSCFDLFGWEPFTFSKIIRSHKKITKLIDARMKANRRKSRQQAEKKALDNLKI